jgi:LysR family cyn operon transcriptional activator
LFVAEVCTNDRSTPISCRRAGQIVPFYLGHLWLAYLPSLRGVAIPALSTVMQMYPGVEIHADEAVARQVERRVADAKIDVGLSYMPARSDEVETVPVMEGRLALVVATNHRLAGTKLANIHDIAQEPFALLARPLRTRVWVDSFFGSAQFAPRVVLESNAVATVLAVVRAGLAITVLLEPGISEIYQLPVVAISPEPKSHQAALIWRAGVQRSWAASAFAEEILRAYPSRPAALHVMTPDAR